MALSTLSGCQLTLANFEPIREAIRALFFLCLRMRLRSLGCNSCVPGIKYVLVRAYFHIHTNTYVGFIFSSLGRRVFYGRRSHITAPAADKHDNSSAPPRVEVVSGLVRQDHLMPSRRFRVDGREASKLETGGGGARTNTLGAPAVAKDRKPGDPLQVQVDSVVSEENSTIQILEATRLMSRDIFFSMYVHGLTAARGARFLLGFRIDRILTQMDQVLYLILAPVQKSNRSASQLKENRRCRLGQWPLAKGL